jgi:hypothetical protein
MRDFRFHSAFRETESGLLVPQSAVDPEAEVKLKMADEAKQAALEDDLAQMEALILKAAPPVQTPARPRQSGDTARRPPQHSRMFMGMGVAADKPRHNRKRAKRDPRRRKAC